MLSGGDNSGSTAPGTLGLGSLDGLWSVTRGAYGGAQLRVSSPFRGSSILITSAPRSARSIVEYGPAERNHTFNS